MKARTSRLAAVSALVLAAATAAAAETIDREFNKRFDVAAGDRLELHFGDGDVEITAWKQDALEVHVRYHAEHRAIGFGSGERRDFTVDFERRGDTARVRGSEPEVFGFGVFNRKVHEYRYTVRAPSYLELDLRGDDGDVRVASWASSISLTSDDGDVELADSRGDLRLRMEDGDVVVTRHQGSMKMRLDDGDVRVSGCAGERVAVEVEDGDVELARCEAAAISISADDGDVFLEEVVSGQVDVRTADGDVMLEVDAPGALELEARTQDGNVTLDLGPGVSARFTVNTDDGRIRIDGPAAELSRERGYASGTIGGGAGTIRVVTADGGVTLRHRSASPTPAERPIGNR